jgi:Bacterial membrane protein YfhO
MTRRVVALLSLLATYLFFCEYLRPLVRVHLFSDIEGFHYPLQRYAFRALKEGRVPQWDPSIYCGIPYAGNTQAAFFYPPTWLLLAATLHRDHLPYKATETLAFAHVWLAFFLCYLWFRGRNLKPLACILGGAVFACGGYMTSQIVHLGAISATTWLPLAFWGIDEAALQAGWRPLWKTALAGALSFLAGYPPSWIVFCVATFLYALGGPRRWRAALGVSAAIAFSLLLSAAQLLPALEARTFMVYDEKYGGGMNHARQFLAFIVPNWFNYNRPTPPETLVVLYLYLGLPAIFAFAWAIFRHQIRPYAQPLLVTAFCLLLATNPNQQIYHLMVHFPFLERMMQSYNFYEAVAAMAALITAIALDDFLSRPARPLPRWAAAVLILALAAWSFRQLSIWNHGGHFPTGPRSLAETAIALAFFSLALWTLRPTPRRAFLAAALLLFTLTDYKVFATNRMFNTVDGDVDEEYAKYGFKGMNDIAYRTIRANRDYRIASDEQGAPASTDFRMWGLAVAQGFDPFLPTQYHSLIERWVKFKSNREFAIDFAQPEMLRSLGIGYVITHEGVGRSAFLAASSDFRLLGPDDSYYRVYEFRDARPPYGWAHGSGTTRAIDWMPERRSFQVHSETGGRFTLIEQFYPGWKATVDGRAAPIARWNEAFQSIDVPPGEHTVVFTYRSRWLPLGTAISILSTLTLILTARRSPAV